MGTARRRRFGPTEQLSLTLVTRAPPEHPVELVDVGYFTAVRMSSGAWWLTVGRPKPAFAHEERTPQRWWGSIAPGVFTLHQWSDDGRFLQGEQDDEESAMLPFDTRSAATRMLRMFNEHYQDWRMDAWT